MYLVTKDEDALKYANRSDIRWIRFCSSMLKRYMVPSHDNQLSDNDYSDLDSIGSSSALTKKNDKV